MWVVSTTWFFVILLRVIRLNARLSLGIRTTIWRLLNWCLIITQRALLILLSLFRLPSNLSIRLYPSGDAWNGTYIIQAWTWRPSRTNILRCLIERFFIMLSIAWNYRLWVFSLFKFIAWNVEILIVLNLSEVDGMISHMWAWWHNFGVIILISSISTDSIIDI